MPSTPWADISASPDTYYDTNAFALPCALVIPELLTLPNLYLLAPFFIQSSSSSNPFRFRSKSEILDKISASKEQTNDHAAQYVEDATGDSIALGIASLTGNGTVGHDNHHGNEDHNGDEGDGNSHGGSGDDGNGNGSKGGNVDDHRGSLKASKLDDTKTTLEPEGGNATTEKPDGATIVSDPSGDTNLVKLDSPMAARGGGRRKSRGGRKVRGGRNMGQSTSSATLTTLVETTDVHSTPNPSTSSAVATDSLQHVVASELGAPPAIMIGSVSAPLEDVPIVAVRPSRKRKQPNSTPTLVAAKIPAAVGADGRPVKRK